MAHNGPQSTLGRRARGHARPGPDTDSVRDDRQVAPQHRGILALQRTIGNRAIVSLLGASGGMVIQRKPADIDNTYTLNFAADGKLTNVKAPRATGAKRTKAINSQLDQGWVAPNEQVIGGHLFKAEFGGPDDETNVVPWSEATEKAFGVVEDEYKAAAEADASQAASTGKTFSATVKTKATFADRPDLKLSDSDLNTAGWGPTQKGRGERQATYDNVAERFSGIPTSVTVTVTGLSKGDKAFAVAGTAITAAYKRNEDAIKPAHVIKPRFKVDAGKPRVLAVIADWDTYKKAKTKPDADLEKQRKLQHLGSRHGDVWGVDKTRASNMAVLAQLQTTLKTFIEDISHQQIRGVFVLDKVEVLHYIDHATKMWVCTKESGELVAGWKLGANQYDILVKKGTVG